MNAAPFFGVLRTMASQLTAARPFFASGWLNPLPPQNDIPGWQRMTMMKYFVDDNGEYDKDALWAYEGVVLPGGKIILGRWWSPSEGGAASATVIS